MRYREEGLSQREIARRLDRDHSAISKLFDDLATTVPLAKLKAQHRALEVTEAAFDGAVKAARSKGRTDAALELLDRLEVLAKRQPDAGGQTGVQVVVNMPGQTLIKASDIHLSPAKVIEPSESVPNV